MSRLVTAHGDELTHTGARIQRSRRDYSARELRAMATDAAAGTPPAGSPADVQIRDLERGGDFAGARQLRDEVRDKAPALARLARAAEKAERRTARRSAGARR